MEEQLSLFESTDNKLSFTGFNRNDDCSIRTTINEEGRNILNSFCCLLTAQEVKQICDKATSIFFFNFGYEISYKENGSKKVLNILFENHISINKRTVYENIDLYFEQSDFYTVK